MKDRTYLPHNVPIRSQDPRAAILQGRLINPQALADAFFVRILSRSGKTLIEGRSTLGNLRLMLDGRDPVQFAKRSTMELSHGEIAIDIAAVPPAIKASATVADMTSLLEKLWLEYSDF